MINKESTKADQKTSDCDFHEYAKLTALGYNKNNEAVSRVIFKTERSKKEIHALVSIVNNNKMYQVIENRKYGLSVPLEIFLQLESQKINEIDGTPVTPEFYKKILDAKIEISEINKFLEKTILMFSIED